jgi:hypothetical protein
MLQVLNFASFSGILISSTVKGVKKMKALKLLCILGLILGMASLSCAEVANRIATLKEISGTVEVKTAQGAWAPAMVGMTLSQGDMIRTQKGAMAILSLDGTEDTASVEVKQNSQLALAELIADKAAGTQSTLLDLSLGEVLIKAKKLHSEKSRFEVKTPTSIVGVRGTTFSVAVEAVE